MATPRFWFRPPGVLAHVLAPLGWFLAARREGPTSPAPVPVVAVGSLSAGGTGKTPTVIAIAQRLAAKGRAVHVVTRGRGAPFRVDERGHSVEDVGDEPLLIAAFAPTWVAQSLAEGVAAAAADGAEVVVLDGGLPERPVAAKLTVVVEDAVRGFGNGFCVPAGPLRAPLDAGLAPADLLITIGPKTAQASFRDTWRARVPCLHVAGYLGPLPTGMDWQGLEVVAFAGIGAPERFFATLRGLGAKILRAQALADHQALTEALMLRLEREAQAFGAQLVTTEKDAVRLPPGFRQKVVSLPVRLELDDWAPLDACLAQL